MVLASGLVAENAVGFVKFLEEKNSGLKILKGSDNSNHWEELTLVNGQVVPIPCN